MLKNNAKSVWVGPAGSLTVPEIDLNGGELILLLERDRVCEEAVQLQPRGGGVDVRAVHPPIRFDQARMALLDGDPSARRDPSPWGRTGGHCALDGVVPSAPQSGDHRQRHRQGSRRRHRAHQRGRRRRRRGRGRASAHRERRERYHSAGHKLPRLTKWEAYSRKTLIITTRCCWYIRSRSQVWMVQHYLQALRSWGTDGHQAAPRLVGPGVPGNACRHLDAVTAPVSEVARMRDRHKAVG